MNKYVSIAISALITFAITAGMGYAGYSQGGNIIPTLAQLLACGALGLVAAGRDVQHIMAAPPP